MKPRGIPIAQVRSDTEGDDKVRLLRELAPDRVTYLAAFGSYMSFVLGAWNKAERVVPTTAKRTIPKQLIDLLIECELLDSDGNIPASSFDNYVGDVLRARAADADRKRNVRRSPAESGGVDRSPQESIDSSSPLLSYGHSGENDPVENDEANLARAREAWVVPCSECGAAIGSPCSGARDTRNGEPWKRWAVHEGRRKTAWASGWPYLYPLVVELTGKHVAQGKYAEMLCELAEQAGPEVVMAAMRAVAEKMAPVKPDIRALAFGTNDAIRRPPSGREIASVVQDEQERAYTARKAAERSQARADRQKRALALVGDLEDSDAPS